MYFYKEYLAQKEKSLMINKYWRLLGAIEYVFGYIGFITWILEIICKRSFNILDDRFQKKGT